MSSSADLPETGRRSTSSTPGASCSDKDDALGLNEQVLLAIEESDVLIFVVDGKDGSSTCGSRQCRARGAPSLRKVDHPRGQQSGYQGGRGQCLRTSSTPLGSSPGLVSAEHRPGARRSLGDRLRELLPEAVMPVGERPREPTIAIVGRPNVGKSSLLNRLLGGDRVLVSRRSLEPPATRSIRSSSGDGSRYVLVDTAGIRRRSQVSGAAEGLAVMMAQAPDPASSGGGPGRRRRPGGYIRRSCDRRRGLGRGERDRGRGQQVGSPRPTLPASVWSRDLCQRLSELLASPARVNISALTGRGVDKLFPAAAQMLEDLGSTVDELPPQQHFASGRSLPTTDPAPRAASHGSFFTPPR